MMKGLESLERPSHWMSAEDIIASSVSERAKGADTIGTRGKLAAMLDMDLEYDKLFEKPRDPDPDMVTTLMDLFKGEMPFTLEGRGTADRGPMIDGLDYFEGYPGMTRAVTPEAASTSSASLPSSLISRIDADMASGMFPEVAGKGPIPGTIYDARDFIRDFGPLTASTHGEEPWRGLSTADFATDARFRPSGLAKFGLGAGSLGAGLMTYSEPLGVGSDIPGRIPAAHHGPVFPEMIEIPIDATGAPIEVDDFFSMSIPSPHLDSGTIGKMSGREFADYMAVIDAFERSGGGVGPGESALSSEYGGLGYGGGSSGEMWT